MADSKISALTALSGSSIASGDLLPLVDISDTTMSASGTSKNTTFSDLLTYLRANGLPERCITSSSFNNSSNTTLTDITNAAFSVQAATYWFKFRGKWRTAATTTGIGFAFSSPSVTTASWGVQIRQAAAGTDQYYTNSDSTLTTVLVNASAIATATDYDFEIEGHATFSASGTLQLRFRSEVNASQVDVQTGIIGLLIKIA